MLGQIGHYLVNAAFLSSILAVLGYFLSIRKNSDRLFYYSNWLYGFTGLFTVVAAGVLLHLILTHQFQYYYVFNYTSTDLATKYLISAFYGGQEGSFMLWIFYSALIGLGLMKWVKPPYRKPVLFTMAFTQVFLLSMIAGIDLGSVHLGASPFRTLSDAMPNAPFLQANPDFVPQDGNGLNDLLKSPWMMIHPPILFLGFSLMTVPFSFAVAALWKRRFKEWVDPALPWTLGANLCLLTAIFLGGYWAYVTLSFGGYWAWDPVENASLVPWLLGTAGIHTMIIQRKSSTSQKAALIFAMLSYSAVVYETFLTRSGILADSSVHSFVDLGLYNQLLAFMVAVIALVVGLLIYRYKELPEQKSYSSFLSREFMTFAGAMMLFLIGLVILLGTSSPIIGRLFTANPTPPEVSYYNEWTMPLGIISAILTVLGQYLFWRRYDGETLSADLIMPLLVTTVLTIGTIIIADIRNIYNMVFLLAGYFAVIGNSVILFRLIVKRPMLTGGVVSHIGFGLLLIGILASSIYNQHLLDSETRAYNQAIEQGKVTDDKGFPVTQKVNMLELKLDQPKIVGDGKYKVTFEGYRMTNGSRPGEHTYRLKVQNAEGDSDPVYLNPAVYPMMKSSTPGNIQWSVDPDVYAGWIGDIYVYVAGSSYVERKNDQAKQRAKMMQQASSNSNNKVKATAQAATDTTGAEKPPTQTLTMKKGETIEADGFEFKFNDFTMVRDSAQLPDSAMIGVRANVEVRRSASDETRKITPMFAIIRNQGKSYSYAPPVPVPEWGLQISFRNVRPDSDQIDLVVQGISEGAQKEWVLLVAEYKPFISIVWLGTFVLMGGFSISIFRHWSRQKKREQQESVT